MVETNIYGSGAPFYDEEEETIVDTKRMPTSLPGSLFSVPEKPGTLAPLDLTPLLYDDEAFATRYGLPAKTKEELDAMFPDTDYTSEKYLALAKAGLALMQPTVGGKISPAIANAGTQLVNDVSAIGAAQKKEKAMNRATKLSYEQQQQANKLQLMAQAEGINQQLLTTQITTNYEQRAKKNALQWEAYNDAINLSAEEALKYGIDKFKSEPVTIRFQQEGQEVERAGFLVNDQYYVPTKQKDPSNGEWIYEIVPDPQSVQIISSKNQDVEDVSKNMSQYNKIYSEYMNMAKNIYSLRQIMRSVDPALGGDPTRVAFTGYIKSSVQKYAQIASDFSKDFFLDDYVDPITGTSKGGKGKVVWMSDLSDIILHAEPGSVPEDMQNNFKMVDQLLDSIEADGMALIDRARTEDLSEHFEGDTQAERQKNKNLIFGRLKFDTKMPENEARAGAIIYALARARKPTGRLNLDDVERAAEILNIYNDSSQAILTKLKVVEEELLFNHRTQADLLRRNFPNDAAILEKQRGSLDYSDDYFNEMFGFSMTPIKQTFRVIPNPDGPGYMYEAIGG